MASRSYSRAALLDRYGEPDHSDSEWVCAFCDCVPVAAQGDFCSEACQDAQIEADRAAHDFRYGIDLLDDRDDEVRA